MTTVDTRTPATTEPPCPPWCGGGDCEWDPDAVTGEYDVHVWHVAPGVAVWSDSRQPGGWEVTVSAADDTPGLYTAEEVREIAAALTAVADRLEFLAAVERDVLADPAVTAVLDGFTDAQRRDVLDCAVRGALAALARLRG